jgi:hypothetical protein
MQQQRGALQSCGEAVNDETRVVKITARLLRVRAFSSNAFTIMIKISVYLSLVHDKC